MTSEHILDRLISIYFKQSGYLGSILILPEEQDFINQKILVKPLFKNGYETEIETMKQYLENKWYKLHDMNVGRSHSELQVKEVPNKWFNTVSFEYKIED